MFDRKYFALGGDRHEHYTINQKPHDAADAARLYGELEEKAASNIGKVIHAHIPILKMELVAYEKNLNVMHMKTEYFIAFNINGARFNLRISDEHWNRVLSNDYWSILTDYVVPELSKALIVEIASKDKRPFT